MAVQRSQVETNHLEGPKVGNDKGGAHRGGVDPAVKNWKLYQLDEASVWSTDSQYHLILDSAEVSSSTSWRCLSEYLLRVYWLQVLLAVQRKNGFSSAS